MNAEPPIARLQMEDQLRRPGYRMRHGLEAQRRWHQANYDATPTDVNRYQLVRLERLLESL